MNVFKLLPSTLLLLTAFSLGFSFSALACEDDSQAGAGIKAATPSIMDKEDPLQLLEKQLAKAGIVAKDSPVVAAIKAWIQKQSYERDLRKGVHTARSHYILRKATGIDDRSELSAVFERLTNTKAELSKERVAIGCAMLKQKSHALDLRKELDAVKEQQIAEKGAIDYDSSEYLEALRRWVDAKAELFKTQDAFQEILDPRCKEKSTDSTSNEEEKSPPCSVSYTQRIQKFFIFDIM